MPRGPRLDTNGAFQHVMARGIEQREIFLDDCDRADFVKRLVDVVPATGSSILAWSLMPNHFHLLVRSGRQGLSTFMRRLQSGYSVTFNRRHRRSGHLFQNRFKSVLVEEEPYLLELVRYIHLNPVRAGLVEGLRGLDRYAWSGHGAILGKGEAPWQDVQAVLERFGGAPEEARARYLQFVAEGLGQGRRPELSGGGLVRSIGGWAAVVEIRRGRERWMSDERVLGSGEFVQRVLEEQEAREAEQRRIRECERPRYLERLATQIAAAMGIRREELLSGSRRREVVAGRYALGAAALSVGIPAAVVARAANVRTQSILRGVQEGNAILGEKNIDVEQIFKQSD